MIFYNTRLFLHVLIWGSVLICLTSGFSTRKFILGRELDQFPPEEARVLELFQQWTKQHGRIYTTSEEAEKRYQIFQRNLKYIAEMNAKRLKSSSTYRLGLNKFADMSPEEFRDVYLNQLEMPAMAATPAPNPAPAPAPISKNNSCGAPASMDWRMKGVVTPVKNQQSCGSCWAFGATGAMESINALTTGQLISLSEQELVDCDPLSHGCRGGWSHYAFEWVIENGGISTQADYPYVAQTGSCKANMSNGDRLVKINSYARVARSEDALLCASAKQPISVALHATDFQLYHSGIFDGENCPMDPSLPDHIVLIVGYDSTDGKDYWIVKNSWGEDWGMNGYILIQRNTNLPYGVCSINAWGYYPTI